jgi:carbon-monoxide dehydrogenase medium subunit
MKPAPFRYYAPTTLDEALRLLAELGPQDGRILAGGQTLVPAMAFRMARPPHLIDINNIAELGRVEHADGVLRIGACVRHKHFESAGIPGPTGRLLRAVVRHIAHQPIRARGTFGGSVANADPASEWCCLTAALDGVVIAHNVAGSRRLAAKDFFTGVMSTDLREDEIVVAVELPVLPDDTRVGFAEFSRRAGDFAIAMVLATYRLADGRVTDARIGIGGAEGAPRRLPEAEAALNGNVADIETFAHAAAAAADGVEPLEDHNTTIDFRRALVKTLTQRSLESAS